jgi:hypothetical protein
MRRLAIALVATAVCAACAGRAPRRSGPAPPAPPPPADRALHVLLTWDAPADLDLYVTDPTGESLYFANTPTRAGAYLDRDTRCAQAVAAPSVEHAVFAAPAPGRYRIGVDYLDDCGRRLDLVAFRVAAVRGTDRLDAAGTAERGTFAAIVLEVAVGEDGRLTAVEVPR